MYMDFVKRTLHIRTADGPVEFPAIQISPAERVMIDLPPRDGKPGKRIPAMFADLLTLRTPKDGGEPYLKLSPGENLNWTTLRFDHVVGLDVDLDGTLLSIEELEKRRGEDIAARQRVLAEAAAPAAVSLADIEAAAAEA